MKIRIDRKGYENFTGMMGGINFVDGVSEELSRPDALRIGAAIRVKEVESDQDFGPSQEILNRYRDPAPVVNARVKSESEVTDEDPEDDDEQDSKTTDETGDESKAATDSQEDDEKSERDTEVVEEEQVEKAESKPKDPVSDRHFYTREELEQIADEKGIEGLRVIASEYNIVGRQILKLIENILSAQEKFKANS